MSSTAYLCMFLAVGLVFAPANGTPATDAIAALHTQFQNALLANDVDTVKTLYASDVIVLPNGYPTVEGLDAIAPYFGWINNVGSVTVVDHDIEQLDASGDIVMERSSSQVFNKEGDLMNEGKSLLIWKKYGDSYKIYVEMYNANSTPNENENEQ